MHSNQRPALGQAQDWGTAWRVRGRARKSGGGWRALKTFTLDSARSCPKDGMEPGTQLPPQRAAGTAARQGRAGSGPRRGSLLTGLPPLGRPRVPYRLPGRLQSPAGLSGPSPQHRRSSGSRSWGSALQRPREGTRARQEEGLRRPGDGTESAAVWEGVGAGKRGSGP